MRIAWEEPFGPVVPIMRVASVDEAVAHCNTNNLGLQVRGPGLAGGALSLEGRVLQNGLQAAGPWQSRRGAASHHIG
jgi:hypothetical protein